MSDTEGKEPQSDHEWTVHSLNIHGQFFERWCEKVVDADDRWFVVDVQHPVAFPPYGPKESTADIRAVAGLGTAPYLVIECKKNNPDFVRWLFFPKVQTGVPFWAPRKVQHAGLPRLNWKSNPKAWLQSSLSTQLPMCDEAREVRGKYADFKLGERTKTSNAAIAQAAYQVALATFSTAHELLEKANSGGEYPIQGKQVIAPVIVTTATLSVCSFDSAAVSSQTGEIPWGAVSLKDEEYLYYLYPVPRHLQCRPTDTKRMFQEGLEPLLSVLPILVVNSVAFPELLNKLLNEAGRFHQTGEDLEVAYPIR